MTSVLCSFRVWRPLERGEFAALEKAAPGGGERRFLITMGASDNCYCIYQARLTRQSPGNFSDGRIRNALRGSTSFKYQADFFIINFSTQGVKNKLFFCIN